MLDRLKFLIGFARAYRAARKEGASREDAQTTAARQMIGARLGLDRGEQDDTTGLELSSEVAALWTDPEAGLAGTDSAPDGAWFGDGRFGVTPRHLALVRHMRLAWDGAERGAPMLDPERPYGRAGLLAQLAEVFETDDDGTLARRHVEMLFVLARVLRHGTLRPGRYALRNIGADDVRAAMRGYGGGEGVRDADLGLDTDGTVAVTDEHIKLLRDIQIRWPSDWECDERLEMGAYPAASADPKRPYGD